MLIAGVDEVGYGSISGPLCVCIAVFDSDKPRLNGVKDSKALTHPQRVGLSRKIKKRVAEYSYGWASVKEIEKYNVFWARDLAAQRAFNKLKNKPDIIYMDGDHEIDFKCDIKQNAVVKGDAKIWQIGAASILAKVHRDEYMVNLSKRVDDKYDWQNNKGYYSVKHNKAMLEYGISKYHRIKFFCIGKVLYKRNEIDKHQFELKYNQKHVARRKKPKKGDKK